MSQTSCVRLSFVAMKIDYFMVKKKRPMVLLKWLVLDCDIVWTRQCTIHNGTIILVVLDWHAYMWDKRLNLPSAVTVMLSKVCTSYFEAHLWGTQIVAYEWYCEHFAAINNHVLECCPNWNHLAFIELVMVLTVCALTNSVPGMTVWRWRV